MRLKVQRIHDSAKIPTKAHNNDAGYDLTTIESYDLQPNETRLFRTGLKIQLEKDSNDHNVYGMFIHERSGLGKSGIGKRAGVCDEGYTGEYMVLLTNHSSKPYQVISGDRIAQLVIQRVESIPVEEVTELNSTERGQKGFASSGR